MCSSNKVSRDLDLPNPIKQSTMNTLESVISEKIQADYASHREPFFVVNLETIVERFRLWKATFPMVKPFYGIFQVRFLFFLTFFAAVKCNPNPGVLHTLARLGTGFDCASKQEMDTILGMGIDQSRIIFANPCKMDSHISHAREVSVKR